MSTQATAAAASPLSQFIANAEAYAKSVEAKIIPVAEAFLDEVETDIINAVENLGQVAVEAVIAQAATAATGEEKLGNVVASVTQTVEAAGKSITNTTANMIAQQAYITVASTAQALTPNAAN